MTTLTIPLSEILEETDERLGQRPEPEVLTLTEKNGFLSQRERFNKRLAVEDTSDYKVVRRFDVAFNPYLLWAGAVAQNVDWDKGIISPLYPTFRLRTGYEPRYVDRFLRSPGMVARYNSIAFGSVPRRRRTSVDDFLALRIDPPPPLPKQRRIAEILDNADALRAKRRAALDKLDTLIQSIFLDMFGDPSTNPKGWPVRTLGEVSDVQGGLQLSPSRRSLPREVPYLRVANVYRARLDMRDVKTLRATENEIARTELAKNDFLIVEGHGNRNEIGRGALWDGSLSPCVHQNHLIRVRFDCSKLEPRYASAYLNSDGGRRHLVHSGKTTSGLNTINVSQARATPIALPPIDVQGSFSDQLSAVANAKASSEAALTKLDSLFVSLQYRAFRGEL